MAKAFAAYEQQIEKLGGVGLLVEDTACAEKQLDLLSAMKSQPLPQ